MEHVAVEKKRLIQKLPYDRNFSKDVINGQHPKNDYLEDQNLALVESSILESSSMSYKTAS